MEKKKEVWDYWDQQFAQDEVYFEPWTEMFEHHDSLADTKHISSTLIYGNHLDTPPVFSIMTPAYRRPDGLKRALDSALNQSYTLPYEIVVVDDSGDSLDNYEEIDALMKEYCSKHNNVIYYRNDSNLGVNDNWNRQAALCRSEWFCILHDDDMLKPDYLNTFNEKLPVFEREKVAICSAFFDMIIDEGAKSSQSIFIKGFETLSRIRGDELILLGIKDALHFVYPNTTATLYNTERFLTVGGLNKRWGVLADAVFFTQCQSTFKNAILPKSLSIGNKGDDSATASPTVALYCMASVYQRSKAIAKHLGYSEKKSEKLGAQASVYQELSLWTVGAEDYKKIRERLGISNTYNLWITKKLLRIKNIWVWLKTLF